MVVTPYNSVKDGQYLSPVVSAETKQRTNLSHIKLPTHDSTRKRQHFNQRYGVDLSVNKQLCTAIVRVVFVVVGCSLLLLLLAAALSCCCCCCPYSTELSLQ